jgi:hypothetical protein
MPNLTEELEKLAALHQSGALTDQEFATAKRQLLNAGLGLETPPRSKLSVEAPANLEKSLGEAANLYVTFKIISAVIGLIVFLIILFTVIAHVSSPPNFVPGFNGFPH